MKTKLTHKKTIRSIFALCSVLLLGFLTQLNTKLVSAEEEPTITIDTISDTATLNLTPTGTGGTFTTSANSDIVFSVSTNNFSGYSLSVVKNDNSRSLVNGDDAINSISSALTTNEFDDSTNNNKWGFKPNKFYDLNTNTVVDNSGEDGVFLPAPTSATQLDKTGAANSVSNSYTITVGMRVNLNATAGEYTGALSIISVANPVAYVINFDNNAAAGDTITDFPENIDNTTFGSSVTLPDNAPAREHYTFTGWCNVTPTNTNGTDACTGDNAVSYQPGDNYEISHLAANNATLYAMWQIDTFTQSVKYRYENIDGTFTDWTDAEDETVNYGDTFTWNPADKITDFDGTPYQVTPISYTVEDDQDNEITFMRKTFTVTKRYKLEDGEGNYPDEFTADGTATVRYGESHTYTKAVDFYITGEVEEQEITDNIYLDLLLERRKYPVYIQKGNNDIETISSDGSYRWGQIITVTGTKYADNNCRTYGTESWTRSGFGNFVGTTTGNTVQYEVGRGTATLRVWGTHEDIPQTITFSAPNGETLTFDDVEYHDGDTTQAICGNHDISATLKEVPMENRIYLQDITPETCPTTKTRVYDRRDEESYYIQKLADGNCWMQDNLRLDSATSVPLTTANTNMSPVYDFELPEGWPLNSGYSYSTSVLPRTTTAHKERGLAPWWTAEAGSFRDAQWRNTTFTVEDSTTLTFQEVSRVGVYYNFCAVTAGTWCSDPHTGEQPEGFVSDGHVYDICPAGWRLPVGGVNVSSENEFALLRHEYVENDDFLDATNTRYGSGMVNEVNTVWHQGNIGYYWSGSPYGTLYGFFLGTWRSDSSINVAMSNERTVGHAARCMMKAPEEP